MSNFELSASQSESYFYLNLLIYACKKHMRGILRTRFSILIYSVIDQMLKPDFW